MRPNSLQATRRSISVGQMINEQTLVDVSLILNEQFHTDVYHGGCDNHRSASWGDTSLCIMLDKYSGLLL